jgi:flavin-dependent dehydrogenase
MGYRVVVLEEDSEIGKPLKCSGLISRNIKKFFPEIEGWGVIENEVDFAVLHSKRSEMVLKKKRAAYVIDRAKFDKKLSGLLESDVRLNCKVEGTRIKGGRIEVLTKNKNFECEMVIGCDGPGSIVGKFAGQRETVKGLIGIVDERDYSKNVDLYFNKTFLKDGFFWKIPRGKTIEYGMWGKYAKFQDMEKFFGVRNYKKFAGIIPVKPVRKSYRERMLLIGDAAGQVKPWSGGGVIYGMTCAKIAAKVIEKAFRFNDFSENVLGEYEKQWKEKIGRQIKFGLLFRKFLKSSTDLQLDIIFKTGNFFDYGRLDMDFIL